MLYFHQKFLIITTFCLEMGIDAEKAKAAMSIGASAQRRRAVAGRQRQAAAIAQRRRAALMGRNRRAAARQTRARNQAVSTTYSIYFQFDLWSFSLRTIWKHHAHYPHFQFLRWLISCVFICNIFIVFFLPLFHWIVPSSSFYHHRHQLIIHHPILSFHNNRDTFNIFTESILSCKYEIIW